MSFYKSQVKRRIGMKLYFIQYKGGKCEKCNYSNLSAPGAFCFHHKDAKDKEFGISGKNLSFDKIKVEVDKCLLLCVRCHAEIHAEPYKELYEVILTNPLEPPKTITDFAFCKICKVQISKKSVYCKIHFAESQRKVTRPKKEELEKLVWTYPTRVLAQKFQVSSNAIAKWCKKLHIKKPKRGYWQKLRVTRENRTLTIKATA